MRTAIQVTIYSAHHQKTIEDFVLQFIGRIPEELRVGFVEQLIGIVRLTGEEAVRSFIDGFKKHGMKGD